MVALYAWVKVPTHSGQFFLACGGNVPNMDIRVYVMYARVWGGPRATKHTKNAS